MARRSNPRGTYKPNPGGAYDLFEQKAQEAQGRTEAGMLLDKMTSEAVMEGIAKRAKRDGTLVQMYNDIVRYIFYVEDLGHTAHPAQLERVRRGKEFAGYAASAMTQNREGK